MTKLVKPDTSIAWAELGDNTKPLDSYIQTGWLAVKPPRQYFNWIDNRQDNAIKYFNQAGIPEWDDITEYEGGFSFVQGSDNLVYRCLADNTDTDPTDQPANAAFWELAFAEKNDFDSVEARVDTLEAQIQDGSGVTDPAAWRTELSVPSTTEAVLDADFTGANQSLATNGYQKLPGGLILQWGVEAATGVSTTVTFPIAFPNNVFSVTASFENNSTSNADERYVQSKTASGAVFTTYSATGDVNWFAIGN